MYLGEDCKDTLNNLDECFELEAMADSGACDTVMPVNTAEHIPVWTPRIQIYNSKRSSADGGTIVNLGERMCWVAIEGPTGEKLVHVHAAEIKKSLLPMDETAGVGFECVLVNTCGFLLDTNTNVRIPIKLHGNPCVFKSWARMRRRRRVRLGVSARNGITLLTFGPPGMARRYLHSDNGSASPLAKRHVQEDVLFTKGEAEKNGG